jgi:hypothetical protein
MIIARRIEEWRDARRAASLVADGTSQPEILAFRK